MKNPGYESACLDSRKYISNLGGWAGIVLGIWLAMLPFMPSQANGNVREEFLKQDVDALLDRRYERIAPFVNWTYGWATSYANSYIVAAHIVVAWWKAPGGWVNTVRNVIREHELRTLRNRVTLPDDDASEISNLIERHIQGRIFADDADLRSRACQPNPDGPCNSPLLTQLESAATSIKISLRSPAAMAKEHADLVKLLDIRNEPDVDFLHALRPLTSRVVILVLRLTELTSIIVLVTAGLRRLYLPNTAFTRIIVTLTIAWGLDYCVLLAERFVNEASFEHRIAAQLEAQRSGVAEYVKSRVAAAEAAYQQNLPAFLGETKPWQ